MIVFGCSRNHARRGEKRCDGARSIGENNTEKKVLFLWKTDPEAAHFCTKH